MQPTVTARQFSWAIATTTVLCCWQSPAAAQLNGADNPTIPTILLYVQRPKGMRLKIDDPILEMSDLLQTGIEQTGKYKIKLFDPNDPSITQAVSSGRIPAGLLQQPITLNTLELAAGALNMGHAMLVAPIFTRSGMTVNAELGVLNGPSIWTTAMSSGFNLQDLAALRGLSGQKRQDAIISLAVDEVTSQIGAPTHFASAIKLSEVKKTNLLTMPGEKTVPTKPRDAGNSSGTQPVPTATTTTSTTPSAAPDTRMAAAVSTHSEDFARQAELYANNGDTTSEVVMLRRAINQHPSQGGLRVKLIDAYQHLGLGDLAMQEASRAIALDPNNIDLKLMYGSSLLSAGNLKAAMQVLSQLATAAPKNANVQMVYGDGLMADGHFNEAVTAYHSAEAITGAGAAPHWRLAVAYAAQADGDADFYKRSLDQIAKTADTDGAMPAGYRKIWVTLLEQMDSRIRDMSDVVRNLYSQAANGGSSAATLLSTVNGLTIRTSALSTYIKGLPHPPGTADINAHFEQAAALLTQSAAILQDALKHPENAITQIRGSLLLARVNTFQALASGEKQIQHGSAPATTGSTGDGSSSSSNDPTQAGGKAGDSFGSDSG